MPPNRKPSKVDTLQGAIDYIHQLERLLEATGGIPDIECMAANGHSHSRQSVNECPFVFDLEDRLKVAITHKRFVLSYFKVGKQDYLTKNKRNEKACSGALYNVL